MPDDQIGRLIASYDRAWMDELRCANRSDAGITVAWRWLPENAPTWFEDSPVYNVQIGKYDDPNYDMPVLPPDIPPERCPF